MRAQETIMLPIWQLETNNGQIFGLPKNPRDIYVEEFDSLVKSIQADPEMLLLRPLMVYPYEDRYVVIGGNMRLHAVRQLHYDEVPCKIIPKDTSIEELAAMTVLDNTHAGDWSEDDLDNDWSREELEGWSSIFIKQEEHADEEDDMVTITLTFGAEEFKDVKQRLNKIDKDNGKAALILFGYGEE